MTFLKIKKGNSQRSIVNALILVRTLFNRTIKKGIVDRKYYHFGTAKIRVKLPESCLGKNKTYNKNYVT